MVMRRPLEAVGRDLQMGDVETKNGETQRQGLFCIAELGHNVTAVMQTSVPEVHRGTLQRRCTNVNRWMTASQAFVGD